MVFLGAISFASGASGTSRSNLSSGASFGLPQQVKSIYLVSDTTGVGFQMFGSMTGVPSGGIATGTQAAPIGQGIAGPFATRGCGCVSVFNSGSTGPVVVRVYATGA